MYFFLIISKIAVFPSIFLLLYSKDGKIKSLIFEVYNLVLTILLKDIKTEFQLILLFQMYLFGIDFYNSDI